MYVRKDRAPLRGGMAEVKVWALQTLGRLAAIELGIANHLLDMFH
jgi:hypothetical protein